MSSPESKIVADVLKNEQNQTKTLKEIIELIKKTPVDVISDTQLAYVMYHRLEDYREDFLQQKQMEIAKIIYELQFGNRYKTFCELKHAVEHISLEDKTKLSYLFLLAFCYLFGIGCIQNPNLAQDIFMSLTHEKYGLAYLYLADFLDQASFGVYNPDKAHSLRKEALEEYAESFMPSLCLGLKWVDDQETVDEAIKLFLKAKNKHSTSAVIQILNYFTENDFKPEDFGVTSEIMDECRKICEENSESILIRNAFFKFHDNKTTKDAKRLKERDEMYKLPYVKPDLLQDLAIEAYEKQGDLKKSVDIWKKYFDNLGMGVSINLGPFLGFVRRNGTLKEEKEALQQIYQHIEKLAAHSKYIEIHILKKLNTLGFNFNTVNYKEEISKQFDLNADKTHRVRALPKSLDEIIELIKSLPVQKSPNKKLTFSLFTHLLILSEEFEEEDLPLEIMLKDQYAGFCLVKHFAESKQSLDYLYYLALCLNDGLGCHPNRHMAYEIHKTLTHLNYPLSMWTLASHYEKGTYGVVDFNQSHQLKLKALENKKYKMPTLKMGQELLWVCHNPQKAWPYLEQVRNTKMGMYFIITHARSINAVIAFNNPKIPNDKLTSKCQEKLQEDGFSPAMVEECFQRAADFTNNGDMFFIAFFQNWRILLNANKEQITEGVDQLLTFPFHSPVTMNLARGLAEGFESGHYLGYRPIEIKPEMAFKMWSVVLENGLNMKDFEAFTQFIKRNENKLKNEIEHYYQHLEQSAAEGSMAALGIIGKFKQMGIGYERNISSAISYYIEAARLGSVGTSSLELAKIYASYPYLDFDFSLKLVDALINYDTIFKHLKNSILIRKAMYDFYGQFNLNPLGIVQTMFDFLDDLSLPEHLEDESVMYHHSEERAQVNTFLIQYCDHFSSDISRASTQRDQKLAELENISRLIAKY